MVGKEEDLVKIDLIGKVNKRGLTKDNMKEAQNSVRVQCLYSLKWAPESSMILVAIKSAFNVLQSN